ncbi:unnamed protein product [Phyllotreta striolata]|uniref:C2H2-type domain-containing protein n=1 Tax=Phyllotreta striolata TaxID=444603 RepID=A0A9N9TXD1_PHYSR|nr:unnamed protein product [Phyllotreta striolata]
MYFLAEDLSLKKSSWENWPSHLVLPMMLMRENMKQSMLQSINRGTLDLSLSPRSKGRFGDVSPTPGAGGGFVCAVCGRTYKLKSSLRNHQKWECGKEPQFKCPYCVYKAKQKMHMARHMERMHREIDCSIVKTELKTETKSSEDRDQDNIENKRIESNNDNSNSFSKIQILSVTILEGPKNPPKQNQIDANRKICVQGKENRTKKKPKRKPAAVRPENSDFPVLTELFMCTKCTKSYRLRHSLTRHIKFECGKEPRYACALCPRKFKHKYDLTVHERGKHKLHQPMKSDDDFPESFPSLSTQLTYLAQANTTI